MHSLFACLLLIIIKCDSFSLLPIRVALTVDYGSIRDMILITRSIVESTRDINNVFVHIVAVGTDKESTSLLSEKIGWNLKNCTPELSFDVTPFHLPLNSGFYKQLTKLKAKGRSHWSSSVGTDMTRFYLPNVNNLYIYKYLYQFLIMCIVYISIYCTL